MIGGGRTIFKTNILTAPKVQSLFSLQPKTLIPISFATHFTQFIHFSAHTSSPQNPQKVSKTCNDLSSTNLPILAKKLISKCEHLKKGKSLTNLSVKDYILRLCNVCPDTVRRYWRLCGVSSFKPQDFLEILLVFESCFGKSDVEVEKIESLWGMFNWASEQSRDFKHFPQSCKIMASMLVRAGLFRECESLLSRKESEGILLDSQEIFSDLIEGYVSEVELDRVISVYDKMRELSLVPALSCYRVLLKYLIGLNETELAHRVYVDMVDIMFGRNEEDKGIYENLIRLLCLDGKAQIARELIKKIMVFGNEPNHLVVNAICSAYCRKKDYDDILSFFTEVRFRPDTITGNKILFYLCENFGVEETHFFMEKLEELDFCPDEITFGILIGWSCKEGKLKNAFLYFSNALSRGLKPCLHSYNALISGLFKEGMWKESQDILLEMNDRGISPDISTYKVLLAGFCKARKFDELRAIVDEMVDKELIRLSSLEDPLTKAISLLGLEPLNVKIRRDNDKGLCKAEFFDDLGNGLYLDTDIEEFDERIAKILDDTTVPDFNSFIQQNCDIKNSVEMLNEMERWGQDLSLPSLSTLVKGLCTRPFSINAINNLLGKMLVSIYQLDHDALNTLAQTYSKKGFTSSSMMLFNGMVRRNKLIENKTYTLLLMSLCKDANLRGFRNCLHLAKKHNWSPELKDLKRLLDNLCQNEWLDEVLELFQTVLIFDRDKILDFFHVLVEILCSRGFVDTACDLVNEFSNQADVLDNAAYNIAYSHLVTGFCLERRFVEAFTILDTMQAKNLFPPVNVCVQLIPQLCIADSVDKAIALKDICSKVESFASFSVHCVLLNGFFKSGRTDKATKLFKEIIVTGTVPEMEPYNTMLQGFSRTKDSKKIMEFLGAMTRKNIIISITSYRSLIHSLCSEGKFSFALSLKDLMLGQNNLPELVLYNILIFHLSRRKNSFLVKAMIDELCKKGVQFDVFTYNFIVQGLLWCNNVSHSLMCLRNMIREGLKPSNRCFRGAIAFLCSTGDLTEALKLSREMELNGWTHSSSTQNIIIKTFLDHNKVSEAVDFLGRIAAKDLIPNSINYNYLIKRFFQQGRVYKALDLLNIMLVKGGVAEPASYDYVIQGFCHNSQWDHALDLYTEMVYRGLKPSMTTREVLVLGLCRYGHVAEAEKIVVSVVDLGEMPSKEMFCAVIDKYQAEKNTRKASEMLQAMQGCGYVPDFGTQWSLISKLGGSKGKDDSRSNRSFLSNLLSGFGFAGNKPDP